MPDMQIHNQICAASHLEANLTYAMECLERTKGDQPDEELQTTLIMLTESVRGARLNLAYLRESGAI